MQAQPLRVIVAEDSALIREGISRLIEESGGTVVAKVGDGEAFVEAVAEYRPDVSVVDVRMPPSQRDEGLRAAIEARRRVPGTPILVLSQYVERQYATELLADGAGGVGYLLKDRVGDIPEFMDALHRVARGGTALDPEVVAQLMVRNRRDDPLAALTPREREVLAAMAEGRTNVGIAKLLSITEGATEKHISNIFGKLELPGLAERPPPRAGGPDLPRLLARARDPGSGGTGISARTSVGPPAGLDTENVPSTPAIRLARPDRPPPGSMRARLRRRPRPRPRADRAPVGHGPRSAGRRCAWRRLSTPRRRRSRPPVPSRAEVARPVGGR